MKSQGEKRTEDQKAVENLREMQAARALERRLDLNNRSFWVSAGNTLKDERLFTGTTALEKGEQK